jgi:hypothetical protein
MPHLRLERARDCEGLVHRLWAGGVPGPRAVVERVIEVK